jgi:hypothetical protein
MVLSVSSFGQSDRIIDDEKKMNLDFLQFYVPYVRALFGCPSKGPITDMATECTNTADLEGGTKLKARKVAKKLFDLAEPK